MKVDINDILKHDRSATWEYDSEDRLILKSGVFEPLINGKFKLGTSVICDGARIAENPHSKSTNISGYIKSGFYFYYHGMKATHVDFGIGIINKISPKTVSKFEALYATTTVTDGTFTGLFAKHEGLEGDLLILNSTILAPKVKITLCIGSRKILAHGEEICHMNDSLLTNLNLLKDHYIDHIDMDYLNDNLKGIKELVVQSINEELNMNITDLGDLDKIFRFRKLFGGMK